MRNMAGWNYVFEWNAYLVFGTVTFLAISVTFLAISVTLVWNIQASVSLHYCRILIIKPMRCTNFSNWEANISTQNACPSHWTTGEKTSKNPEHYKTGRPWRSDPKQYIQLQNTKPAATTPQKGPAGNSVDSQCFLLCLFSFFSDVYNPKVNLSYFNQLHKTLNPINNEISLNTTNMQYP